MNSNIKNIISALVLTGFSVTGAFAQMEMTNVTFTIDETESFDIVMMRNPNENGGWMINDAMTEWNAPNRTFVGSGGELQVNSISYSEFPFIAFDFSVTDTGAASSFSFGFTTPITLAAGPTEVFSNIGGSITDGSASNDGVTLTPNPTLLTADVDGIALTNAELGFAPVIDPAGFPTGTNFGFDTGASPLAGPTLAAAGSFLSANVDFTLTGDDDRASINGRVDINAVPEPSTYTLIAALGAASFVFFFRKRK